MTARIFLLLVFLSSPFVFGRMSPQTKPNDAGTQEAQQAKNAEFTNRLQTIQLHDFESLPKEEALRQIDKAIGEIDALLNAVQLAKNEDNEGKVKKAFRRVAGFFTGTATMAGAAIAATGGYQCPACIPRILGILVASGGANFYLFFKNMSVQDQNRFLFELQDLRDRFQSYRDVIEKKPE